MYLDILAPFVIVIFVMVISSSYSIQGVRYWYNTLPVPPGNPPQWVFSVVWPILYLLIAISWSRLNYLYVFEARGNYDLINSLFFINLLLNVFWTLTFFYARQIKYAFFILLAIIGSLLALMYFVRFDKFCFWILVPYLLWLLYASYLNGYLAYTT